MNAGGRIVSEQAVERPSRWRRPLFTALRVAPWVVFGPITGVLGEVAARCFMKRRPVLGGLCIALNIGILVAIPTLTAWLAGRL
jgi:hypothetical protein